MERKSLEQDIYCLWQRMAGLFACLLFLASGGGWANTPAGSSPEKLKQDTALATQNRVQPLITQYCREACSLIDIKVYVDEVFADSEDLGFEGVSGEGSLQSFSVAKVVVTLQVDDRISPTNREQLGQILKNNLLGLSPSLEVIWHPVTIPQMIPEKKSMGIHEEALLQQQEQKLEVLLQKVIDQYCPDHCLLEQVVVTGHPLTADEAASLKPEEVLKDRVTGATVRRDKVRIGLSIDGKLDASIRKKIENIITARTKFVSPVSLDVVVTDFPESYAVIEEKRKAESTDPFGLEKLRQTLTIFKELAGTKELITKTVERAESHEKSAQSIEENKQKTMSLDLGESLLIGVALLVVVLLVFLGAKLTSAQKQTRLMLQNIPASQENQPQKTGEPLKVSEGLTPEERQEMALRVQNETMRQELIQLFFESPRVARETFSRILQDEGVEITAKYVHIFGQMIIFELLNDPSLQRDLHDLAEFYHQSYFVFSTAEINKLLQSLRVRTTANEMRVLTQKQTDKFDFLRSLDANQIFSLIVEEKPQVQSIVLTQLDPKRRRAVFELYTGQRKLELMKELSRAEFIPNEYLSNVAKALQKKVAHRPEFDSANLKSSDLLFDLMERASIDEQKDLMRGLMQSNPEAARAIKLKFVTVEILPYLKDGHLLEIILGTERNDLLQFLAGTREHIRQLIMAKAPDELAEGWMEDLGQVGRLDEQQMRLVELKILGRIRQLAANGFINILDINEIIFAPTTPQKSSMEREASLVKNKSAMVA